MNVTEDDLTSFIKFSKHVDQCADWRLPTPGMIEVNELFKWFNDLGVRIQQEVKIAKEASSEAEVEAKSKDVLQKLKKAK